MLDRKQVTSMLNNPNLTYDEKIFLLKVKRKVHNMKCDKCKGWINPPWKRGDGDYKHCECKQFKTQIL